MWVRTLYIAVVWPHCEPVMGAVSEMGGLNKPQKTQTEPHNANRKQQLHGKALITGT